MDRTLFYTYKIEDYCDQEEDYIHIWGLDQDMNDILVRISGFRYSVMIPIPSTIHRYEIEDFCAEVTKALKYYVINDKVIIRRLYNYRIGKQSNFLVLFLKRYNMRHSLRNKTVKYRHHVLNIHNDVGYPAHLQYSSDHNISYGDWHECSEYDTSIHRISRCNREIITDYRNIKIVQEDDPVRKVNLRPTIMSYDIECISQEDTFPNANKVNDEIFLITVSISGRINENVVFTRYSCDSDVNGRVIKVNSEEDLLLKFQEYIIDSNPEVLIGYNTDSFDNPYITQRLYNMALQWINVGKLRDIPVKTYRPNRIPESGTRDKFLFRNKRDAGKEYIIMSGRVHIDLFRHITENYRMRSFSLDSVSNYFLNEGKHDISMKDMFRAVKNHPDIKKSANSSEIQKIYDSVVRYGIQDSELVLRLESKLVVFLGLSMMARVMSTNIDEFYIKGSSHKVKNMLYRRCRERKILIKDSVDPNQKGGYQGALILEPKIGLHKYVYTLDLDSLYPNIVRSYNICYTTLIRDDSEIDCYDLKFEDNGMLCHYKFRKDFVGVIPEICASLIERRTEVRKRKSDDPVTSLVNDKLQLALKIAANSIYGVLGLTSSPISFIEGARSVTAMGRLIIGKIVKELVQKGHDVLYGDTDSVMAKVPGINSDPEIYRVAVDTMKYLNEWLKSIGSYLGLKLEKTGTIFLIKKKKYVYHYWDPKTGQMEMDKDGNPVYHTTGAESVRRDKCIYQIKFFDKVSDMIMKSTEQSKLYDYIYQTSLDFLRRYDKIEDKPLDQDELLISYTMNDYYKNESYSLGILMKRLKEEQYDVKVGQREDVIITTKGDSTAKLGERMYTAREYKEYHENPGDEGLHPNYFYYLDNRIRNAVDNLYSIAYPSEDLEEIRKDYILNLFDEYHDHPVLSDYTPGIEDMEREELNKLTTKVINSGKLKRYRGDKRLSLLIFRLRLLKRRYIDLSVTTPCKQLVKTIQYKIAVLNELLYSDEDSEDIYDDDYYS